MPDIMEQEPVPQSMVPNVIIVDGCPTVGPAKLDALTNFVLKKFSTYGSIVHKSVPIGTDGQTKGYMFIVYDSPESAAKAAKEMDKTALDKSHTFCVTLLSDFTKYVDASKQWIPPEKKPYQDVGNIRSWLLNEFARDQYGMIHQDGDKCSIFWHSNVGEIPAEERDSWSEGWIRWSPHGTYLATMHSKGIILWGGDKFDRVGRFAHSNVAHIDFSPNERFVFFCYFCIFE